MTARRTASVLAFALVPLVSACVVATPFRGPGVEAMARDGERPVLVALTMVELGPDRAARARFWDHVWRVTASLEDRPGFIGHSVRREVFGRRAWTMTVWRDEASLEAFVTGDEHRAAISEGYAAVTRTAFWRRALPGAEVPLSWPAAEALLAGRGRSY